MSNKKSAGFRFLRAASQTLPLLSLLALPTTDAMAASWQWSQVGQHERVSIVLDNAQGPVQARRNGRQSLLLPLAVKQENFTREGSAPAKGRLVQDAVASPQGLEISLQSPAFGYLVSRPEPGRLVVDIFYDPLGARWTADGTLAPAAEAQRYAPPAASAASAAPAPAMAQAPASVQPSVPVSPSPVVSSPSVSVGAPAQEKAAMPLLVEKMETKAETEQAALPLMDSSATLRPEMPENTPEALMAEKKKRNFLPFFPGTEAEAADSGAGSIVRLGERGLMISPQELLGKVNTGGSELWPEAESLSTTVPGRASAQSPVQSEVKAPVQGAGQGVMQGAVQAPEQGAMTQDVPTDAPSVTPAQAPVAMPSQTLVSQPQPSPSQGNGAVQAPVQAPSGSPAAPAEQPAFVESADNAAVRQSIPPSANATLPSSNATRPVIYMDEAGNIVPKPLEPDKMLLEAERLMESTQYVEALPILEEVKAIPGLDRSLREKALYLVSDATEAMFAGKPLEGYDPIVSATSEAMNANLRSPRVPDALFRLGMANLRVGNVSEAEGYFKALKRRFPYDINVPVAFTNLGTTMAEKGLYPQAAEQFRSVLQEYPESNVLREAAVGLVEALIRVGDYKQAAVIADFVDKRWARYYVTSPAFLELMAELSVHSGRKEEALQQYWLYYNLDPARKGNDKVLATIGDLYFDTGRPKAGLEIFSEIRQRFPDTPAATLALLRLAERGKHDGPLNINEMFGVFENPGNPLPQVAYRQLRKEHPGESHSILGWLKLAAWQLWNKQYTDAMGTAADFIDAYPEHKDVELAREVITRAFMADLKNSLAEENYGRILILWNGFPLVRERYGPIDAEMRNALARGYLERGEDDKAMELFAEFLKTPKHPRYSDQTFALYFNKYLQSGNWNALLDLGAMVQEWDMDPGVRGQLDYAMALSSENLGLQDKAMVLWKPLSANESIPLYQRAYATYFLAKDAERRRDIRDAYTYNKASLDLFNRLQQERSDKADPERVKEAVGALMDITEVANRIPEALEWVEAYNAFVPDDSPEYPGLRFREARLYRKLGDTAKARSLLEALTQRFPDSPFAKAAATELSSFSVSRDLRNFLPGGQGGTAP